MDIMVADLEAGLPVEAVSPALHGAAAVRGVPPVMDISERTRRWEAPARATC